MQGPRKHATDTAGPTLGASELIEATTAALLVISADGPLAANAAFGALIGLPDAGLTDAVACYSFVAPSDRARLVSAVSAQLDDAAPAATLSVRLGGDDCVRRWADVALRAIDTAEGRVVVATLMDTTELRNAMETAEREQSRALRTLATIGNGVIRVDAEGRVEYLNAAAERLTGWSKADANGQPVAQIYQTLPEVNRDGYRDPVADCLATGRAKVGKGLATLLTRTGHELVVRDNVTPLLEQGQEPDISVVTGAVVVFEDVTEVRGLEREMVFLASHDPLTGLLNRSELEIHLEATRDAVRSGGGPAAFLMLDVARFRLINDSGGHHAGDELLRQVAMLLTDTIDANARLARLGGDQFGILLPDCAPDQARRVAETLHDTFRGFHFAWGGQQMEVRVAIGLVVIDEAAEGVSHLFHVAEEACRSARHAGAHRVHEARPPSRPSIRHRGPSHWLRRLQRALAENDLRLHHQRIVSLAPDRPGFHEILVRMVDAQGELVAPASFVPIAEQYRLAPALDRWVVREALRLLRTDPPALRGEAITINLSGQSLGDESFLGFLNEQLSAADLAPRRVLFEITETAAVANLARAVRFLGAMRDRGFRFVLDDFGSGMSSFGYLKNLPVAMLKIDGAFVRTLDADPLQCEMVRSMNEIGHRMGLATIAEWVESAPVLERLHQIGVDYVQGYHVHRPAALVTGA